MKIEIEHTREKLKQFGIKLRLKGNEADRVKRVMLACQRNHIEPVISIDGEVCY